jgi:phage anti-repressor protein
MLNSPSLILSTTSTRFQAWIQKRMHNEEEFLKDLRFIDVSQSFAFSSQYDLNLA